MSVIRVVVKWGSKKFEDVKMHLDQPVSLFKAQMYTLTGVEPNRQKFFVKGTIMKDDQIPQELNIQEGQQIMLMGSTEVAQKVPPTPLIEEKPCLEEPKLVAPQKPKGLANLGNTCYFNATVQCFRAIEELSYSIKSIKPKVLFDSDKLYNITKCIGLLFRGLDERNANVSPTMALKMFRDKYPQFAEKDSEGYLQQDAEECWSQLIHSFENYLPGYNSEGEIDTSLRFIEQFMTGTLVHEYSCLDAPDEECTEDFTTFNKLAVNIGAGSHTYMMSDIANGFNEKIEKMSPTLSKSATYSKKTRFTRLPYYLVINFVRFQWKNTEKLRAKILKKVEFPHKLDAYSLCAPALQKTIYPAREKIIKMDQRMETCERMAKIRKYEAGEGSDKVKDTSLEKDYTEMPIDKKIKERISAERNALRECGVGDDGAVDIGLNNSGMYELIAVLTHVGRTADYGHYIAWIKRGHSWYKMDDEDVSGVGEADIEKLCGGGDWHSAYICVYKGRDTPL